MLYGKHCVQLKIARIKLCMFTRHLHYFLCVVHILIHAHPSTISMISLDFANRLSRVKYCSKFLYIYSLMLSQTWLSNYANDVSYKTKSPVFRMKVKVTEWSTGVIYQTWYAWMNICKLVQDIGIQCLLISNRKYSFLSGRMLIVAA